MSAQQLARKKTQPRILRACTFIKIASGFAIGKAARCVHAIKYAMTPK